MIEEYKENQKKKSTGKIERVESFYQINFGMKNMKNKGGLFKSPSMIDQMGERDSMYINFTIKIKDTGQGISEEGLKNLFINFSSLKEHQT